MRYFQAVTTLNGFRRYLRGLGIGFVIAVLSLGSIAVAQEAPEGVDLSLGILQAALKELGHYSGDLDAEMGPMTAAGIRGWQEDAGFPVTGDLTSEQSLDLLQAAAEKGLAPARDLLDSLEEQGVRVADAAGQARTDEVPTGGTETGARNQGESTLPAGVASSAPVIGGPTRAPQDLAASVGRNTQAIDDLTREQIDLSAIVAGNGQAINSLDLKQQAIASDVKGNGKAISDLRNKLIGTTDRTTSTSLRVDSLVSNLQQAVGVVESQRDRIEDNSVKLFETLIGIDGLKEEQERIRKTQALIREATLEKEAGGVPAPAIDVGLRLLLTALLCMLVLLAVLLYRGDAGSSASAAGAAIPEATTWMLTAWFGGGVGYYLLGAGVMFGATIAGFIGTPTDLISGLLLSNPAKLDPAILDRVISHALLVGVVSVTVCSASAVRLSSWGHLLVALAVGALVYPLFGHWSNASTILTGQPGWLSGAGFISTSGTTGVALLGGVMALSLAGGLRRKDTETTPEPADRGSARMETVGAVLLWVAWSGVLLAAGVGDLPLPALLIVIAVTIAAGALSVLLVELLFSAEPQHRPKVAWAALAGLVAAPGAYAGASFAELLLLGAAAGLSYQLLVRILNRGPVADIELAAALAAGGLWGTMAPVLFGKGGILYVGSVQVVLPQLLGLGVALVLATASGRLLALPAVRIDLLRARL